MTPREFLNKGGCFERSTSGARLAAGSELWRTKFTNYSTIIYDAIENESYLIKENYIAVLGDLLSKGFKAELENNGSGFTRPLLLSRYPFYTCNF